MRDIDYKFIVLNRSLYRLNAALLNVMQVAQDLQQFEEYRDVVRMLLRYSRGLSSVVSKLRSEVEGYVEG